jgi:hypothetical protein
MDASHLGIVALYLLLCFVAGCWFSDWLDRHFL